MIDVRKINVLLKKEMIDGLKVKNLIFIYIFIGNCFR